MRHIRFILFVLLSVPAVSYAGNWDSICETPLHFEVLGKGTKTDDYLWIAGDRKYNIYYKDSNLLVEQKMKKTLWLIHGHSFASYPLADVFIDTVYFKNISESNQKELIIGYSQFSLRQTGATNKSKHILIADLAEQKIVLNIATYDFKIGKDENGKVQDYLYEADVKISHNYISVTSTEDSDIDNPSIQLDDGVFHRHGHCFVKYE